MEFPSFGMVDAPQFDYIAPSNPTVSVNPKRPWASWMNSSSGELFVCTVWTPGANTWVGQLGTTVEPV